MSRPILLSILTMPLPQSPLKRLQALIIFYLKITILTPIAVIWNQSYILRHPDNPLPTIIISPWSQNIYAYSMTSGVRSHLVRQHPTLLRILINQQPHPQSAKPTAAQYIEGDWHGPLLQPGIVVSYKRDLLYVFDFPTSTPSYPPIFTTSALSLRTNIHYSLLSPQKFVARPIHYDPNILYASSDSISFPSHKISSFLDV
jgi:hypothetical protein